MGSSIVLAGALTMALLVSSCWAYDFYVGGRDGWVEQPRESYNSWAGRNRFQVNDRLIFKYKQGNDSVLVVTEPAYNSCNLTDPVQNYTDGNTIFQFNHSGPFYFVSGAAGRCTQGQKLVVVVLAIRNHTSSPPPAPSPYPPPSASSPSPSPSPSPATPSTPGVPAGSLSSPPPPPPSSSTSGLAVSKVSLGVMVLTTLGRAFIS